MNQLEAKRENNPRWDLYPNTFDKSQCRPPAGRFSLMTVCATAWFSAMLWSLLTAFFNLSSSQVGSYSVR
jgi:hypothetical protein